MINFSVHTKENHVKAWDEIKLAYKLHKLAKADKNTTWLHRNLSIAKSSVIGRLFWCIAKHFDWMRRAFYDIDLKRSQAILLGITAPNLIPQKIFNLFNCIRPLSPSSQWPLPSSSGAGFFRE